jgi:uncharacterized heparinase superfamily protein
VSLLRTINTVRHLKPVQVGDRLMRRLRPVRLVPEDLAHAHRLWPRAAQPPAWVGRDAWDGSGFRFVGLALRFTGADRWAPVAAPLLWTYNLHYFAYLWETEPARAWSLIEDWLAANPPLSGPGWEPYPISLRAREWIEWLLACPELPPGERDRAVASLVQQVAALEAQLEVHLQSNHLLENAITLCWAGLSLKGPLVVGWRRTGLRLLVRELRSQVLADGTHEERSPMYQALLIESLARLAGVARAFPGHEGAQVATAAGVAAARMLASLATLCHPDGQIALLNDSAFGIAPTLAQLGARFPELATPGAPMGSNGGGGWELTTAGYRGWAAPQSGSYVVFDTGPIGPDHQPGHGHADALSFEVSHRGRRVITDTGVSTYEAGPARSYDRGTAAHSTIEVDGRDQSELWAAFRCGRRISIERAWTGSGAGVELGGAYAGPGRGFGRVRHQRVLTIAGAGVDAGDVVTASGRHRATARLHLAPGLSLHREQGTWRIQEGAAPVARFAAEGEAWDEGRSPYHPEFGVEIERACLVCRLGFADRAGLRWHLELL